MAKLKDENRKAVNKYITIMDGEVWELIGEIMQVDDYSKSFNKVINEALRYGIVELYGKIFFKNNDSNEDEMAVSEMLEKSKEDKKVEDYLNEIVGYMKEIVILLTITKSIVSQSHEIKLAEIEGEELSADNVKRGHYANTPKYLESYEMRALNNLRDDRWNRMQ